VKKRLRLDYMIDLVIRSLVHRPNRRNDVA